MANEARLSISLNVNRATARYPINLTKSFDVDADDRIIKWSEKFDAVGGQVNITGITTLGFVVLINRTEGDTVEISYDNFTTIDGTLGDGASSGGDSNLYAANAKNNTLYLRAVTASAEVEILLLPK